MSDAIKLSSPSTREFWEIPVLYEDEHVLALDKPAGLLISADRLAPDRPNLMQLLHSGIAGGKPWAKQRGLNYLRNAHRLDDEASGVILFAKTKAALVTLLDMFGSGKPLMRFQALIQGIPPGAQFAVDAKLAPDLVRPGLMRIDSKGGKRSRTVFEVAETFSRYTLVNCEPLTDRAHQVRLHLRHAGFPVVGDLTYGGKPLLLSRLKPNYRLKAQKTERPLLARAAVHSEKAVLPHPVSGESFSVNAPWPKDLEVAVKYLRRYAAA